MQRDGDSLFRPIPSPGESNVDYRKRLELLQIEAAERRQRQIDEQSSPLNSPANRLVDVIATNTGLTLDEVRAEQVSRVATK